MEPSFIQVDPASDQLFESIADYIFQELLGIYENISDRLQQTVKKHCKTFSILNCDKNPSFCQVNSYFKQKSSPALKNSTEIFTHLTNTTLDKGQSYKILIKTLEKISSKLCQDWVLSIKILEEFQNLYCLNKNISISKKKPKNQEFHKNLCSVCLKYFCLQHPFINIKEGNIRLYSNPSPLKIYRHNWKGKYLYNEMQGPESRRWFDNYRCLFHEGMDVDDCLDPFVKVFNDLGFYNPCAISLCLGIACYFYKVNENVHQVVLSKSQKMPINCVTRPQTLIHNNTSPNCKCNDVCDSLCPCIQGHVKSKKSSYQSRGYCEKYCKCSYICPYKFLGCDCGDSCNSSTCVCYLNSIECDSFLCRRCHYLKQHNSSSLQCLNQKYQKQPIQKTILKISTIKNAGIGLFAKNLITKGQFIGEYTGELVNDKEADRRGRIYDIKEHSFVFNIDCMHSVDATYYGNKMKFINHMPSEKANCNTQIWRVLGTSKILVFASIDINEGDELFFDYKYPINVPYRWYHEA